MLVTNWVKKICLPLHHYDLSLKDAMTKVHHWVVSVKFLTK